METMTRKLIGLFPLVIRLPAPVKHSMIYGNYHGQLRLVCGPETKTSDTNRHKIWEHKGTFFITQMSTIRFRHL